MTNCSLCDHENSLVKLPSSFSLNKLENDKKVGDLVKESIEDFRQDLEQEKENIRNEFYDPNK